MPRLNEPRSFDVLLNGYEQGHADPRADAVVFQAGTKTTAIRRLLAERPDCLLSYDAALFLDDDIELSASDIEALFAAMAAERLDLAQPALTADSECAWPFLKRPEAPNGVFRVSTVEIMAPLMTRRALKAAGSAFSETVSGWGTDLLLGPAVRGAFGAGSVGVIGSVAVRHARKVDLSGGAYYAYLRRYEIDPAHEANRVVVDFGVELAACGGSRPGSRVRPVRSDLKGAGGPLFDRSGRPRPGAAGRSAHRVRIRSRWSRNGAAAGEDENYVYAIAL